jgi:hypothetical protein
MPTLTVAGGGLAGAIEKFVVTRVLTSLHKEELRRLERAAQPA